MLLCIYLRILRLGVVHLAWEMMPILRRTILSLACLLLHWSSEASQILRGLLSLVKSMPQRSMKKSER
ncbi:hypothetical protein OR16_13409 [Cupriavidus basilensis OR16]|uniref:Uncharacterized protein n=1 Tax=Cupriavidus basilensis OR16 TaxID=1127483 RepID=H1S4G6_9BURK|nr:hypothetical protein OR16_13409 [Cupriavidus basilensis OR16]